MIYSIEVKSDRFECLMNRPFSWELLIDKSVGLVKGDRVQVIEVSNSMVPTGNKRIGVVMFLSNGDVMYNNNSSIMVYCEDISRPVGDASISSSFIIN